MVQNGVAEFPDNLKISVNSTTYFSGRKSACFRLLVRVADGFGRLLPSELTAAHVSPSFRTVHQPHMESFLSFARTKLEAIKSSVGLTYVVCLKCTHRAELDQKIEKPQSTVAISKLERMGNQRCKVLKDLKKYLASPGLPEAVETGKVIDLVPIETYLELVFEPKVNKVRLRLESKLGVDCHA